MRTAQMCDAWRSVWGSDPRLVCVLGAQAAWSFSATEALKCPYWTQGAPCSGHAINAVAVAPYMGGAVPAAWASQADRGLANLFQSLYSQNDPAIPAGGFMAQDAAWVKDFITKLAPYKLPLLAYEGGQSFANGETGALNSLYMAANRDPRMGEAYTRYFQQWKTGGGQLFMYFNDVGVESKYGSWGALESVMQTTDPLGGAPPKWQAIQNFISEYPCWWPGCSGAIDARQKACGPHSSNDLTCSTIAASPLSIPSPAGPNLSDRDRTGFAERRVETPHHYGRPPSTRLFCRKGPGEILTSTRHRGHVSFVG